MAGDCCCHVETRSSSITAFATMNIVIFASCVLICSKEYVLLSQKLIDKESKKNKFKDDIVNLHTVTSDNWEDTNEPIFRLKHHLKALIAATVISTIGMIAGILLMCAPKRGSKCLYIIWILFECIVIALLLLLAGFIVQMHMVDPTSWHSTISKIPFSAYCILCSCPFLLWSVVVTCTSAQNIIAEEQRRMFARRKHRKIPLINVCQPSFEIPPSR